MQMPVCTWTLFLKIGATNHPGKGLDPPTQTGNAQMNRDFFYSGASLIPPNPPTARDIRSDGIFTLDPETGINTICFDDQGEADHDRIIALGHPEVQRYVKNVEYRF